MKVYLVYLETYESGDIVQAIFLKEESAENYIKKRGGLDSFYIYGREIDEDKE